MSLEDRCTAPDGEHFAKRVASTEDERIEGQEACTDESLTPKADIPVASKIAAPEATASPDIHGETFTTTPLLLPLESGLIPADTEPVSLFLEANSKRVPHSEQEDMEVSVGTDGACPSQEQCSPGAVTRTMRERDTGGESKIGELTLRPLPTQPLQIAVRRRWEEGETRLLNATLGAYFEELQVKNLKPKQNEVVKILRRDNLMWLMDTNGITRTMEKVRVEFKRFLRGGLE